jgi:hypothetical protein
MLPRICGHSKHETKSGKLSHVQRCGFRGLFTETYRQARGLRVVYGCRSSAIARRDTRLTLIFFCRTRARS